MATIKLTSVSSTVFKVGTSSFLKGDYTIEVSDSGNFYLRPKNTTVGNSFVSQKAPWKTPQPYTAFVDSSDAPYADATSFSLALANLVAGPANASTSDLISDKTTVTQQTSITTGVTASALNSVITTVSSTLAADASASFVVTNTKVTTASNIQITCFNSGAGVAIANVTAISAGSFTIKLTNCGTSAFNSAIKLNVLVA